MTFTALVELDIEADDEEGAAEILEEVVRAIEQFSAGKVKPASEESN